VDTRALLSLATVAETGSFSRAASALGFTQSAVSQHVAGLERTAGTPLLTRRPTVAPTPAGREFLRHARQILAHEQAARAAVARVTGLDQDAPVSVAVTPATEQLLPVAGRPGLDLATLADARWIDTTATTCSTSGLESAARLRLRRGTTYTGTSAATVAALVRGGYGLHAAPASVVPPDGLAVVPLTAPRLVHRIEVRVHAEPRAAVLALADAVGAAR
jgi:DNA-binding transcriptional LysR family regulator